MNEQQPIDIIFADTACIVVNKPAGLLSIPDGYNPTMPYLASNLARSFGKVWIVHRLDRDTSGLMVVARTLFAHREFNLQFEYRQIQKIYHALIVGFPDWESIEVDTPLKINGDRRHRTVPSLLDGKKARTTFTVLNRYANGCLVAAHPQTGYTHQIRAHLTSLGYPIFGDKLYQNPQHPKLPMGISLPLNIRTYLHARILSFDHPIAKIPNTFVAPYPEDFLAAIQFLDKK